MRDTDRLLQRLRELGHDIPLDAQVRRTYAGRHQRAQGALSWFLVTPDGRDVLLGGCTVGSQYPVWWLLKAAGLSVTSSRDTQVAHVDPL